MAHEQSETIQREDGRWINVYGRDTPKAGQQLPGTADFATVQEAEAVAKARSAGMSPGEQRAAAHVAGLDPVEGMAQDMQPGNLAELRREITNTTDPERRSVLVAELENISRNASAIGRDLDFRPPGGAQDSLDFAPPEPNPVPPAETPPEPDRGPALAGPGEFGVTPGGAVTGRTQVPAPRNPEAVPISREAARVGIETAGAFVGGGIGARFGQLGMRVGESVGAGTGSLIANVVDPLADPAAQAFLAGSSTFLTGGLASAGTGVTRKLVGKPHEAGIALSYIMARKGKLPMAGAALESDFIRNAETIGGTAFGTSELLKKTREEAADVTAEAIKGYVSGYQRFQRSAELAFQEYDIATRNLGVITIPDDALNALKDVVAASQVTRGAAGSLDTHLLKVKSWMEDETKQFRIAFTLDETQKIYGSLYDKARALELRAARGDAGDKADHGFIMDQAAKVRKIFDDEIDKAVANKAVDPEIRRQLRLGQASWKHWQEGKELELMLTRSTDDLAGEGNVQFKKLGRKLDEVIRRERETGTQLLSPNTKEAFRRYILAGKSVEDSGKAGAYGFIGRVGQLAGLTGLGYGLSGPGAALFLGPHALAFIFSNETARGLLMRGLRLDPGSAAALRAGRELATLLVENNVLEPERIHEGGPAGVGLREEAARRFVPGAVNPNYVPNPNPPTLTPGNAGPRG